MGHLCHLFPLHVNIFRELFSDVINPKVDNLKSCITGFISSYTVYGYKLQLEHIIKYYLKYESYFKLTESFKSFISTIDTRKLIEPYIKILIDALDHDIEVLTTIYSFFRIFNHSYEFIIHNIKYVYKYLLIDLRIKIASFFTSYLNDPLITKILKNIDNILSLIYSFHNYPFQYLFIKNMTKGFKEIKDTILKLKIELKKIEVHRTDYISTIKEKLESAQKTDSSKLKSIEELDYIKKAPEYLYILKFSMKSHISSIKYFKKIVSEVCKNIDTLSFTLIGLNLFKQMALSYNSGSELYDLLIKQYDLEINYFKSNIKNKLSKSLGLLEQIIRDLETLSAFIPNLANKLKNAKSKLDKKEYIEHLLEMMKFENIYSLNKIDGMINKIEDKSKINDYLCPSLNSSTIIKKIFDVQNQINGKEPIKFIKEAIKQSYSTISKTDINKKRMNCFDLL